MKSDLDIRKDIEDELSWQPRLHANEIGVAVKNGIVTLSGTVKSFDQELSAEKAAFRVNGVRGVANEITVKLSSDNTRTDSELAEASVNALRWNSEVPGEKIKVQVEKGWITLQGDVEWRFQADEAYKSVAHLVGVKGVINDIKVKPHLSPSGIKTKITTALERNAEVEANNIKVETDGSTVILKGSVPTWHQRQQAELAAWGAPGVYEVKNQIGLAELVTAEE
jgi:osmotically-inducible protein OsmY